IFNAGNAGKCKAPSGTPAVVSVVPSSGQQGQQNLAVNITGQSTHFLEGTTAGSFGPDITVTNVIVSSPTGLSAQISIAPNASIGNGNWSTAPSLLTPRYFAGAAANLDGRVFIVGGEDGSIGSHHYLSSLEAYDPITNA